MTASSATTPRPPRSREKRRRLSLSQLTALTEAGLAIVRSQLDVDALCELVYQQVNLVDGRVHSFHLGLFERDSLPLKVWVQDGVRLAPASFPGRQEVGIVGWVRATQRPLLVRDFLAETESSSPA